MYKILFFILLLITQVSAKKVEFVEKNYINALDMTTKKEGSLDFLKASVILKYKNENKIVTFNEKNIIINTANNEEILKHEENLHLKIFFTLVTAIHYNDLKSLKEDFEVIISDNITLMPNDYISFVIEKIQFKKVNSKLEYLKIDFTNGNRIEIVQND